jgi:hypothetical protein
MAEPPGEKNEKAANMGLFTAVEIVCALGATPWPLSGRGR